MTRRVLFSAIAAAILTPAVIARWKRHQERREFSEWLRELEPLRARHRDRMRAQGLDPDCMTEDEKMDYVVRVIDEYREEQRQKERAEPGRDRNTCRANKPLNAGVSNASDSAVRACRQSPQPADFPL